MEDPGLLNDQIPSWQITVANKAGRQVRVMLFQSVQNPRRSESYCTAWKVNDIGYLDTWGPIYLPQNFQFYVLDRTVEGKLRETGPIEVKLGNEINIHQENRVDPPTASTGGTTEANNQIKVTNMSGNAQPLQMALYRSGSKIVSFKRVTPDKSIYLSIRPVIFIADAEEIVEGDEFKAAVQTSKSTAFKVHPDKPNVEIQITVNHSGELVFSEI